MVVCGKARGAEYAEVGLEITVCNGRNHKSFGRNKLSQVNGTPELVENGGVA